MHNHPQSVAKPKKRQKPLWIHEEISPAILCVGGLLLIAALGVTTNPYIRGAVALAMITLSICFGKKIRILPNLIIIVSLTLMYCLTPFGKVLFTVGNFPITQGAIERGLHRAFLLIALLYVSRLYISPRLQFPGYFGRLLGETLKAFELLQESEHPIKPKTFIADIDTRLLEVMARMQDLKGMEPSEGTLAHSTRGKAISSVRAILFLLATGAIGVTLFLIS